jgi:hypothetical protein
MRRFGVTEDCEVLCDITRNPSARNRSATARTAALSFELLLKRVLLVEIRVS